MACVTATVSIWIAVVSLVVLGGKLLNWIWLRPRRLEKFLRQQGFAGNSYRIFYGDLKDRDAMREQAISKPMNFSNDIAPRVIPSVHHTIQKYGKNSFMWFGPIPRLHIMDPEQLKTVFALINDIQKPVMVPAFYHSCYDMVSKWESMVFENGSCELDVMPYLQQMAAEVISRTAFGSSLVVESQIPESPKFCSCSKGISLPKASIVNILRYRGREIWDEDANEFKP